MENILNKLSVLNQNYGACIGGEDWLKTEDRGSIESVNPSNGNVIANVYKCSENDYEKIISASSKAFAEWRKVPAPIRG